MTLDLFTAFKTLIDKKKAGNLSWLDFVELAEAVSVAILELSGRRPRPMGDDGSEEDLGMLTEAIAEFCSLTGSPLPMNATEDSEEVGAGPLLPILIQILPIILELIKKKA